MLPAVAPAECVRDFLLAVYVSVSRKRNFIMGFAAGVEAMNVEARLGRILRPGAELEITEKRITLLVSPSAIALLSDDDRREIEAIAKRKVLTVDACMKVLALQEIQKELEAECAECDEFDD
jgi:hypothetical protein